MFPLFFPYRWTRNDWQERCGAEYSADRDDDFISLFAHYQLFTCTVIFSLWTHFLTFCRQQCGENQKSPSYQNEVHDKQLSRFMSRLFFGLSQDAPLCHKMSCVSSIIWTPVSLCPNKEAVKCLTSYSLYINVMTSSKIPKVCSNKKFKYSGSAISLSLLCAGILFGRIRYLSSQPTHAVDKIFWGINFENQKVHHILNRVHEMVQGFTG